MNLKKAETKGEKKDWTTIHCISVFFQAPLEVRYHWILTKPQEVSLIHTMVQIRKMGPKKLEWPDTPLVW